MTVKARENGLFPGISRACARRPLYKDYAFEYVTSIERSAVSVDDSRVILGQMRDLSLHPGNYQWHGMVSWGGAVFSALKYVDRPIIRDSFPHMPDGMKVLLEPPLTWEGIGLQIGLSITFMTYGLPIPFYGVLSAPTDFGKTALYLGLNAIRNMASDLISKHGLCAESCFRNLGHIKWDKMADSIFSTAFCYPMLSYLKGYMHDSISTNGYEALITSASVCLFDAILQVAIRKLRGFPLKTAIQDCLRPVTGDAGAFLTSTLFPSILGNPFLYLTIRKLYAETFSGIIEGSAKRREKIADRKDALQRVLNLDAYQVPDPPAMAAINLVYLTTIKSATRWPYRDLFMTGSLEGTDYSDALRQVHAAMEDDDRIAETASFIFPFEEWQPYRERMAGAFKENRGIYHNTYRIPEWLVDTN